MAVDERMSQPMLDIFEPAPVDVAVMCFFWGDCKTVIRRAGAQAAHDAMEEHYATDHADDISRVLEAM